MAFKVNWDNGASACGTFSQQFDTEKAARAFADNWMLEMNGIDEIDDESEGYFAEVSEAEDDESDDTCERCGEGNVCQCDTML